MDGEWGGLRCHKLSGPGRAGGAVQAAQTLLEELSKKVAGLESAAEDARQSQPDHIGAPSEPDTIVDELIGRGAGARRDQPVALRERPGADDGVERRSARGPGCPSLYR